MNNKPGKSKVSPTGGDLEGAKENPELGESLRQVISLKAISLGHNTNKGEFQLK